MRTRTLVPVVNFGANKAAPRCANTRGHGTEGDTSMQDQRTGLCQCGCGQRPAISAYTHRARGWVKGQPRAYIKGHNQIGQTRGADYEVKNAGHTTPCWLWLKSLNDKGYGFMVRNLAHKAAHVAYYEDAHGPVAPGLEVDHLCRVRRCVNPDHLEAVTHKENMVRAMIATHVPGTSGLKDARIAARMSQSDVARALGVSQSLISTWELNGPTPDHVLAYVVARIG